MISKSDKYTIVGVMSGTSLDGLDLAICEFEKEGSCYHYKILQSKTISYGTKQKSKLMALPYLNVENYFLLHHVFGKFIAKEINSFLKETKLKVDVIASHGHTIFHQPQKGFTTQIGCGATISANTQLTTVYDFRSLDVALGGQGAPLVPIGDDLLFGMHQSCLNIGGIANISFSDSNKKRIAFDICPANMAFNFFAKKEGFEFDDAGQMAAKGTCNTLLLQELNQLPFYQNEGAKSLGREWFENDFIRVIENYELNNNDIIATLVHHCAFQIAAVLNKNQIKNVFITGGGAYNTFLIQTLKEYFKGDVILPNATLINYKEALIFAFLGYLRLTNQINTFSSVTGAKHNSCGGAVYTFNKN